MSELSTVETKVKAEAKTWLGYLKSVFSSATAIIADGLKDISPQFAKAEVDWKAYTPGKKVLAAVIVSIALVTIWALGGDLSRLVLGSYRSAYTYGRDLEVTPADLAKSTAGLPTKTQFDVLSAKVAKIEADQKSIDDKLDLKQGVPITTASLPVPKKTSKKSALKSFTIADPSTW